MRSWMMVGLLALSLTACAKDGPTTPAPIGDRAALETLAKHYEDISDKQTVTVPNMTAKGRKEFVERVFAESGYQYTATLHKMAQGGWDAQDQNARDLAQLLMLPHHGMRPDENVEDVYSAEELESMRKLQAMLP